MGNDRVEVRTAGSTHGDKLTIGVSVNSCGDIRGGVSIMLGDDSAGFVADWEDFERAYLAAKAYRESEDGQKWLADHRERLGPPGGNRLEAIAREAGADYVRLGFAGMAIDTDLTTGRAWSVIDGRGSYPKVVAEGLFFSQAAQRAAPRTCNTGGGSDG